MGKGGKSEDRSGRKIRHIKWMMKKSAGQKIERSLKRWLDRMEWPSSLSGFWLGEKTVREALTEDKITAG